MNDSSTAEAFEHRPVMMREVVEVFATVPPGVFIDATLGGGGHAAALLDARVDCTLLGLDRDADALAAAAVTLSRFGDRVRIARGNFAEIAEIARSELQEGDDIVGILFDLGVSSPQLDRAARGFTFREEAPLDMRMDMRQETCAADVVNTYDEEELARIIYEYGEERHSRRIARRIVENRPIQTTRELAEVVVAAIPAALRRTGRHPARRTFQAIRMEVNRELPSLERGLDEAVTLITPGGRVAVISYHSLEDRMVKQHFAEASGTTPYVGPMPPLPVETAEPMARLVKRGAWKPSEEEVVENPRARSARLRALERISETRAAS
ncbi:MAG: 16S rRNA (cytosine(1402)-N(4))-methyltransferase RsmH [Acidimicrobiia bacterium]